MFDISDPKTLWLNLTNIALGLVTLVCLVLIGKAIWGDLRARIRKTADGAVDSHAYTVAGLGLTMADGGERLDQKDQKKQRVRKSRGRSRILGISAFSPVPWTKTETSGFMFD